MDDRFDQLAPRDVAITLRSLRRRFGAIASGANTTEAVALVDAPGPSGDSLSKIVTSAAQAASLVANEFERSLDHASPVIPLAAVDPTERVFVEERSWPVADAIGSLVDDADRAGVRLGHATASEQARSIAVAGGDTTTPLDLARILARDCIASLHQAERQLEWIREQS